MMDKQTTKAVKKMMNKKMEKKHEKYMGRGTRARLNTAGEKMMFGRKSST